MDTATLEELATQPDSLFAGLSADELALCAERFETDEVLAGTTLTREGDFSYRVFVVIEGQVQVLRDFETIATLHAGECFGEMGVVDDEKRNARVVAVDRSVVASMIGWDFRQLCDDVPALGARIEALIEDRRSPNPTHA